MECPDGGALLGRLYCFRPTDRPDLPAGLDVLMSTCNESGVPLVGHKLQGLCTKLVFLGIDVDTVTGHLCLPLGKLHCLRTMLQDWQGSQGQHKKGNQTLIGSLHHACKVVKPGLSFLRRMLALLHRSGAGIATRPHHHIRLNREFHPDL